LIVRESLYSQRNRRASFTTTTTTTTRREVIGVVAAVSVVGMPVAVSSLVWSTRKQGKASQGSREERQLDTQTVQTGRINHHSGSISTVPVITERVMVQSQQTQLSSVRSVSSRSMIPVLYPIDIDPPILSLVWIGWCVRLDSTTMIQE